MLKRTQIKQNNQHNCSTSQDTQHLFSTSL
uniref:Uncharacterized protein n=1 Tax=Rhizophora mucronata TaxID=61149 RepID=A0A2P2QZ66_RHIMU